MKKHIANILMSVRVAFSIILLVFFSFTDAFLMLFCICGITDLIDEPIARATGSQSALGAKLH
ncbi:MAG: CDP-alcohol phosphatidyltransferase family protein [Lachnospiraceae bacterium]|nr:CDP-alcohol phosphatidyltransferase family protein [Lachnospiraceae bacterium]